MLDIVQFESGKYGVRNNLTGIILLDSEGNVKEFDSIADAEVYGTHVMDSLAAMIADINSRPVGE